LIKNDILLKSVNASNNLIHLTQTRTFLSFYLYEQENLNRYIVILLYRYAIKMNE